MPKPDLRATSRFPDLEIPGRDMLIQLLRFYLSTRGDILTRGADYPKRLAIGSAYQQLRVDSGGDDVEWANLDNIIFTAPSELTIDTDGAITITQVLHTVDTFEDGDTDDLVTVNGGTVTNVVLLRAENDARTVVVKHNTGNIWLVDKVDYSLDDVADGVLLIWDGTRWIGINSDVAAQIAVHAAAADPHAVYVKESEFTAAEDILVGTGSGTLVKATPAEVLAILSSEADAAFSWNAQDLSYIGHIGAGNQAVDSEIIINAYEIFALGDNNWRAAGLFEAAAYKTSAAFTNYIAGYSNIATVRNNNTQNWTNTVGLRGVESLVSIGTGTASPSTITGAACFYGYLDIGSAANDMVLTNFYGLYLKPSTLVGNSKLTNNYGIYIGNQAGGATLNYAIYTNAGLVHFGDNVDIATGKTFSLDGLLTTAESELTLDTDGAITVTQMRHKVDTFEGAASDDLVTINGGTTVNLIILRAEADARTVVIKHGTGNIWLQGKADVSLDDLEDGILLVWDSTNSKWFDTAAGGGGLVADSVDGSHLSQDFGASSGRLLNFVPTPIAGKSIQVGHSSDTQFFGKINGAPTATSVVYDGDSNEGMFNTLVAWDGTNYWGKFVLHNTTRANSRLIEEVNIATNTITTESSADDWADDDDLTCQSQVNAGAQFVDLDLSDQVPTTTKSVLLFVEFIDLSAGAQAARALYLHPYTTWNLGKKLVIYCDLASERTTIVFPMEVISQKITLAIDNCSDVIYALTVIGYFEYADT